MNPIPWFSRRHIPLLLAVCLSTVLAKAQSLDIGGYQLVSQKRFGRTLFEYTLRARATNRHEVPVAAAASLSIPAGSPGTIVDGDLTFSAVRAGNTALSDDVFTIRLDRAVNFSPANLVWNVTTSNVPDYVVADFRTLSQTRFGRTSFEYVIAAEVLNFTSRRVSLRATASPKPGSSIVITDDSLIFPDVPAGGSASAFDTFTLRIDRTIPLDLTRIQWSFDDSVAYPDVLTRLEVEPKAPLLGTHSTHWLVVSNCGPGSAASVEVRQAIPANAEFISAELPSGIPVVSGTNVIFTLPNLPADSGIRIPITLSYARPGQYKLRASTTHPSDLFLQNNETEILRHVSDVAIHSSWIAGLDVSNLDLAPMPDIPPRGDVVATEHHVFAGGYSMVSRFDAPGTSNSIRKDLPYGMDPTQPVFHEPPGIMVQDYQTRSIYMLKGTPSMSAIDYSVDLLAPIDEDIGLPIGPVVSEMFESTAAGALPVQKWYPDTLDLSNGFYPAKIRQTTLLSPPVSGFHRFAIVGLIRSSLAISRASSGGTWQILVEKEPFVGGLDWTISDPIWMEAGEMVRLRAEGEGWGVGVGARFGWVPPGSPDGALPMAIPTKHLHMPHSEGPSVTPRIGLSRPIQMNQESMYFSGYGWMAAWNAFSKKGYLIEFSTGEVTDLGKLDLGFIPGPPVGTGVLERRDGTFSFVYPLLPNRIVRFHLNSPFRDVIAMDHNFAKPTALGTAPWLGRWYHPDLNSFNQHLPSVPLLMSGSLSMTLLPEATAGDLAVIGSTLPGQISGSQFTSTFITITNRSLTQMANVRLTNHFSHGMTDLSAVTPMGACQIDGATVVCTLGDLPPKGAVAVELRFRVPPNGRYSIEAIVGSSAEDSFPGNNAVAMFGLVGIPILEVQSAGIVESDSGVGILEVPIVLTGPLTNELVVRCEYSGFDPGNNTNLHGTGNVFFPAGTLRQLFRIEVPSDDIFEGVPTVLTINIEAPPSDNYVMGQSSALGTIEDNEPIPQISFRNVEVVEGDSSVRLATLQMEISPRSIGAFQFSTTPIAGTATPGADFDANTQTFDIPPRQATRFIALPIIGDNAPEPTEKFQLKISRSEGALGNFRMDHDNVEVTILDDDSAPYEVDHFEVTVPNPPLIAGEPFSMVIKARDSAGHLASQFSAPVSIRILPSGTFSHLLATNRPVYEVERTSTSFDSIIFSMEEDIDVLKVWAKGADHVSLVDFEGRVLFSTPVQTGSHWIDVSEPIRLEKGVTYRFTARHPAGRVELGKALMRLGEEIRFLRNEGVFPEGDTSGPLLNLEYRKASLAERLQPSSASLWTNGCTSVPVIAFGPLTSARIAVDDHLGHQGTSEPFAVLQANDLEASLALITDSPTSGQLVHMRMTLAQTGPLAANAVEAIIELSPGFCFQSAVPSQGTCQVEGTLVTCLLGDIAAESTAWVDFAGVNSSLYVDGKSTCSARAAGGDTALHNNVDSIRWSMAPAAGPSVASVSPTTSVSLKLPDEAGEIVGGIGWTPSGILVDTRNGLYRIPSDLAPPAVHLGSARRMMITDYKAGRIYALSGLAGFVSPEIPTLYSSFVALDPMTGDADPAIPPIPLEPILGLSLGFIPDYPVLLLSGPGRIGVGAWGNAYLKSTDNPGLLSIEPWNLAPRTIPESVIRHGILVSGQIRSEVIHSDKFGQLIRTRIDAEQSNWLSPSPSDREFRPLAVSTVPGGIIHTAMGSDGRSILSSANARLTEGSQVPYRDVAVLPPNEPLQLISFSTAEVPIVVTNQGLTQVEAMILSVQIPPAFEFYSASAPGAVVETNGNRLILRLSPLGPGESVTARIVGSVAGSPCLQFIAELIPLRCDFIEQNNRIELPMCAVPPIVSFDPISVPEGDSESMQVSVTARIPAPLSEDVIFAVWTADSILSTPNVDFEALPETTLTIPKGSTSVLFNIKIFGDRMYEADEPISLYISPIRNVRNSGFVSGPVIILNDDPLPTLSISNASENEGDNLHRNLRFVIRLSQPHLDTFNLWVATQVEGHSADPNSDFHSVAQFIRIPAGATEVEVIVATRPDSVAESDETLGLSVTVTHPATTGGPLIGIGTIVDDDNDERRPARLDVEVSTNRVAAGTAVTTTIRAVRQDGSVVSSYAGPVEFSAVRPYPPANQISFPQGDWLSGASQFSIGYQIVPSSDLAVRELNCLGCQHVNLWDENGMPLEVQTPVLTAMGWSAATVNRGLILRSGRHYYLSAYFENGHRFRLDVATPTFPHGEVTALFYQHGDRFPSTANPAYGVAVGMKYDATGPDYPTTLPSTVSRLANGEWTGQVTLNGSGNVRIVAWDNDRLSGTSEVVKVIQPYDLELTVLPNPSTPAIGEMVEYQLVVSNIGLQTAEGIVVTNTFDPLVSYLASTGSHLSAEESGKSVILTFANIPPGGHVASTLVGKVRGDGILQHLAWVRQTSSELPLDDNQATTVLEVVPPCAFQVTELSSTGRVTFEFPATPNADIEPLGVSRESVLVSDGSTSRMLSRQLGGMQTLSPRYGSLVCDISSGEVYAFGDASGPKITHSGNVDRLFEVTPEKSVLLRKTIPLSQPVLLGRGGVFSGHGACVLYSHPHCYRIRFLGGRVDTYPGNFEIQGSSSGSEAITGIAEFWDHVTSIVYVRDSTRVVRMNMATREETPLQSFSHLGIMPSIAAAPQLDRWYFRPKTSSQFGNVSLNHLQVGYANASYQALCKPLTNDLSLRLSFPAAEVYIGETVEVDAVITNSGPNTATGVELRFALPPGVGLGEVLAPATLVDNTNGSLRIAVPNLSSGQILTVRVRLIQTGPKESRLFASVSQDGDEDYLSNNSDARIWSTRLPNLSIIATSIPEGDADHPISAQVASSRAVNVPISFRYRWDQVSGSTRPALQGEDFIAVTAEAVIPAGATSVEISTTAIGDNVWEPDETLRLTLDNVTNAMAQSLGVAIDLINDDPIPVLSVEIPRMDEQDSGQTVFTIRLRLSNPSYIPTSYSCMTVPMSANNADYVDINLSDFFPARSLEREIPITVLGDTRIEGDETFKLLVNSSLQPGSSEYSVTLFDDDNVPGSPFRIDISGLPSTMITGQSYPFSGSVVDWFLNPVAAYSKQASVTLTSIETNLTDFQNIYPLDGINHGTWSVGYEFSLPRDSQVRKVSIFGGRRVSFWELDGTLIRRIDFESSAVAWKSSILEDSIPLRAGRRYRVSMYFSSSLYRYHIIPGAGDPESPVGTIHGQYQVAGLDGYPTDGPYHSVYWPIHFTFDQGTRTQLVGSPTSLSFINGVVNSHLVPGGSATNVFLTVDDAQGLYTSVGPIQIATSSPPLDLRMDIRRPLLRSGAKPAAWSKDAPKVTTLFWDAPHPPVNQAWTVYSSTDLESWLEEPTRPESVETGSWKWEVPSSESHKFFRLELKEE